MRRSAGLLAVAAVGRAGAPAPAGGDEKKPTAVGRGGAAATVDTLATKAAINTLRAAATPSTRRSPRPACSASSSRSRAGIGGGGSW